MAKLTKESFIESLKEMSLLEIKELVDAMKEEFGVDPSSVAVAAPVAGAAGAAAAEEKEEASAKLDSITTAIRNNETTFGQAVLDFSEEENTRQNEGIMINPQNGTTKFQLQDLPSDIAKIVYTMKEGEISAPFTYKNESGKEMICVVRLKSRIKAHKANPQDDYQTLKDMVTATKNQEYIENWIKEKQKETYIQISPEYKNCKFHYPGWIK